MHNELWAIVVQWTLAGVAALATMVVTLATFQLRRFMGDVDQFEKEVNKFRKDINEQLSDHKTRITVIERQLYTPQERREILDSIITNKNMLAAFRDMEAMNRRLYETVVELKAIIVNGSGNNRAAEKK